MENQPSQVSPLASTSMSPTASATKNPLTTGDWPPVPPAPAPVIPASPEAAAPSIRTTLMAGSAADHDPAEGADATAPRPRTVTYDVDDDSPTMTLSPPRPGEGVAAARSRRHSGSLPRFGPQSPLFSRRVIPGQRTMAGLSRRDLVWQPRFAYISAAIIAASLTVVSLPLWLVLYRSSDAGAPVSDLIALCMMLTGGYLTGAAIWLVLVEMRARVRMVDRLARTGEREVVFATSGHDYAAAIERPHEGYQVPEPLPSLSETGDLIGWEAPPMPTAITARVEAQQASATATLEASSKLLTSFSSVLRAFGQLPAQVALICVAIALFVGATVLSLN